MTYISLFNQIQNTVNKQFIDAKLERTRPQSPRTGYYFIRSVSYQTVGIHSEVLMAEANYKKNEEDYFVEDLVINIAIRGLMVDNIEHPPLENNSHLVGRTLYIYNPVCGVQFIDGKEQKIIKAPCHYTYEPVQFMNQSNAGLIVFFGKHENLKDAYDAFLQSGPYNFADALEWEATPDHIDYDMPDDGIDYDTLNDNEDNPDEPKGE